MKIGIATELFPPMIGGQEIRYEELGKSLLRQGHDVEVLTIRHDPSLEASEDHDGIFVQRGIDAPNYRRPDTFLRRDLWAVARFSWEVANRLRRRDRDIWLINQWPLLPGIISRFTTSVPFVVDWCEMRPQSKVQYSLQKFLAHSSRHHLAISRRVSTHLQSMGVGEHAIHIVPSGIESAHYSCLITPQKFTDKRLLFVGRLTQHKRADLAISAVAETHTDVPFKLDIIGDGPEKAGLEALASRLGVSERVTFHGFVHEAEKVRLLQKAWALILPSEKEGFPRVFAEAMSTGTPIITVDFPGNGGAEVVLDTRSGVVCQPNATALSGVLRDLSGSPEQWQAYAASGLRSSQALAWDTIAAGLADFFEQVLSEENHK